MSASRLIRFLACPPRILSLLAVLWLIAVLVASSDTGVHVVSLVLFLYSAVLFGVLWLVRVGALVATRRGLARPAARRMGWWTVVPLSLLTGFAFGSMSELLPPARNPLLRLRFALSETALTHVAEALVSDRGGTALAPSEREGLRSRRRIGLFVVRRVDVVDRQVRFITTSCGVVDACGIVYSPGAEPRRWQEDRFTHLQGSWWHVYEGF
jgi:hypothetical protein